MAGSIGKRFTLICRNTGGGGGGNTNTSSVHVLLSCKAHFYGRAFINGTDICSAIDILVGPA